MVSRQLSRVLLRGNDIKMGALEAVLDSLVGKLKNSCANALPQTSGGKHEVNIPGWAPDGEMMGFSSFSGYFLGASIGSLVHLALEPQSNSSVKRAL